MRSRALASSFAWMPGCDIAQRQLGSISQQEMYLNTCPWMGSINTGKDHHHHTRHLTCPSSFYSIFFLSVTISNNLPMNAEHMTLKQRLAGMGSANINMAMPPYPSNGLPFEDMIRSKSPFSTPSA